MTNEELACRLQHGDTEALWPLWTGVERFARLIVRRYTATAAVDADDLLQCAFIGVREAALAYDGQGSFLTLMGWRVRKECRKALGMYGSRREVEVGASLDAPVSDDEDALGDLIPDDSLPGSTDALELEELRRDVRAAVDALPDREAQIIRAHWFDDLTLAQAGQALGISAERARQIEQRALERLSRNPMLRRLYRPPERCSDLRQTGLAAFRNSRASSVERDALSGIEAQKRALRREELAFIRGLREHVAEGLFPQEIADLMLENWRASRGVLTQPKT